MATQVEKCKGTDIDRIQKVLNIEQKMHGSYITVAEVL